MKTASLSVAVLVVSLILAGSASATVPDTVRIGTDYAYSVGDGVFKVPVHIFNDNYELDAITLPMRYSCTGGLITPDSVTRAGRTLGTSIFNLLMTASGGGETNPDTMCLGLLSVGEGLPPGQGIVADVWFSGEAAPGDLVSFIPVDFAPPACEPGFRPEDPDGGPVIALSHAVIVSNQLQILCDNSTSLPARSDLVFDVSVYGGSPPWDLVIAEFEGPTSPATQPYISGSGPWEVRWRPGSNDLGQWTLTLGVWDDEGLYTEKQVGITVTPGPEDPCDIVRGDLTCDEIVDIEDLVFLAAWMYGGGPPPDCPGTKLNQTPNTQGDTVWIGTNGAQHIGDGIVRVPVYLTNTTDLVAGLHFPFAFECSSGPLSPDSITRAGRTLGTDIFDLHLGFSYSGNGTLNPDSACAAFISLTRYLPAGSGVIADMWFSGAGVGDSIWFTPIEFYPPSCEATIVSDTSGYHELTVVPTAWEVGPASLFISCGLYYQVQAFQTLTFDIGVAGGDPPYDLEIVELTGSQPDNQPALTGYNPYSFHWTPNGAETGDHRLTLRATDADNSEYELDITIHVLPIEPSECDYLRADVNCDAVVNISDLVYMVTYMFGSGPPPDCGSK
jgi:hypothetical protein